MLNSIQTQYIILSILVMCSHKVISDPEDSFYPYVMGPTAVTLRCRCIARTSLAVIEATKLRALILGNIIWKLKIQRL
jgi:archaellum component FlaG (FlaF/FlaG flagellin family)